jgi:hypothetical protein
MNIFGGRENVCSKNSCVCYGFALHGFRIRSNFTFISIFRTRKRYNEPHSFAIMLLEYWFPIPMHPTPQRTLILSKCLAILLLPPSAKLHLLTSPHPRHPYNLVLRVQIIPDSPLQLGRALAEHAGQILEVVTRRDAEFAHKVLCGGLEVAVVFFGGVVFWAAEVGVGGD